MDTIYVIANEIIDKTKLPMLGCEHAWVAAGALIAAIRNEKTIKITDEDIKEALNRTKKQAIGAYCGMSKRYRNFKNNVCSIKNYRGYI